MSLSYLRVFEIVGISVCECLRVSEAVAVTNAPAPRTLSQMQMARG